MNTSKLSITSVFTIGIIICFCFAQISVHATARTWSGPSGGGAWITATNWTPNGAPSTGDDITVNAGFSNMSFNNVTSVSLNSLTISGSSSSAAVSLTNSGSSLLTIGTLSVNGSNLSTSFDVSMAITAGTIASGYQLTNGATLTISGTLTVNGSGPCCANMPLVNNGTMTVNNGGLVNYTGSSVTGCNMTVSSGAELRFSGSGLAAISGPTINGLLTLGGSVSTASGTYPSYGEGSTLQYTGTSQQTANYYEFSTPGPTNLTINNASGVTCSASASPFITLDGSLTLTSGVFALDGVTSLTFETSATPIVKGAGTITTTSEAYITFNSGPAFTLPANLFTSNTNNPFFQLTIDRGAAITLENQTIDPTFLELDAGPLILGTGNVTTDGVFNNNPFSTSNMVVTSSTSGYLNFVFDTGSTKNDTLPLGDMVGTTEYTPVIFNMDSNSVTRTVGFRLVDGIDPNMNNPSAPADYISRYWNTTVTPSTGTYTYDAQLYYNGSTGDVVGTESDIVPVAWNASWIVYPGALNTSLHYIGILGANQTTAPLGYDLTGRIGAATLVAPVATAGTGATCNQFTANWNASTGATLYYLDVATDINFSSFVSGYNELNVGNALTYIVTGLSPSTTYYYRVRSSNGTLTSDSSNVITISTTAPTPTAPTAVAGSGATCSQITANWDAAAGATNYFLDVSTSNNFSSFVTGFDNLNVGNVTTYNVTGLTAGTTYYYQVRASNACGTSGNSGTINYATSSTTVPVPNAIAGSGATCTQITANWGAAAGATDYFLDVSTTNNFSSFVTGFDNLNVGNVTTYNVTGLTAGTIYYYQVRTSNSCGTSINSDTIQYSTLPATPVIPVASAGTGASCNQITANWNASSGATSYYLDVSTTNNFSSFVSGYDNLNVGNVITYNITGLTAGQTYYYQVRASNSCGTSASSTPAIQYATLPGTPAEPVASVGTGATCNQITANWNTSTNATTYFLDVSTTNNFSSFVSGYDNLNVGDVTTYNVTGLTAGQTYYYQVRASNSCGTSASSSPAVSYATLAAPGNPSFTSGAATLCVGSNSTYAATASNATSVTYSIFSGGASINASTGAVSSVTSNFTVRATATNTCGTTTADMNVTVNNLPSVNVSNNSPICAGSTLKLSVNVESSYNWSGPNGFTNTATDTPTIIGATTAASGIYNVTVTDGNGCSNTGSTMVTVNISATPTATISANPPGTVCTGTPVTFSAAITNGGNTPGYQWLVNGVIAGTADTLTSDVLNNGDSVRLISTSNASCVSPTVISSNTIIMVMNSSVTPAVSISSNKGNVTCSGFATTFTPSPSGGGNNPTYQWKLNGKDVTTTGSYTTDTLKNGDQIQVVMTTSSGCANAPTATSNIITMNINALVTPGVSIAPDPAGIICSGTNVIFTPSPTNGGSNPTYKWYVNGVNVSSGATFSSTTLNEGDSVSAIMTSSDSCVTINSVNSNYIVMSVTPGVTPSAVISSDPSGAICSGVNVTFHASLTNGGTSPLYQWLVNGISKGIDSNFVSATLNNGDQVRLVITSSATCASPATDTSNTITVTVTPSVTPSVTISEDPTGPICSGTNVIFTAVPVNGGSPSFQWLVNGNDAGSGSSFSTTALNNADQVEVIMISTAQCATSNSATSNIITESVSVSEVPSVTISADPAGAVCTGSNVTFTAFPVNGGNPTFQWLVNGNNSGTGSVFSSTTLNNTDSVVVIMASTASCATVPTATSNIIVMNVNGTLTPSVVISSDPSGAICAGTNVTFTANPSGGGSSPSYQWLVNSVNAGTGPTYNSSILNNGDQVEVVMTSDATCASTNTATNTISMTVTAIVTPSITITADPAGPICVGTSVTFTAYPVNGGSPTLQWLVNGNNTTNGISFTTNTLDNGDMVKVTMISTASCATTSTATSNTITETVTPNVAPSVTITANPSGIICNGTEVTFTASPVNGGSPTYLWLLNDGSVDSTATYSTSTLANGDQVKVLMTPNGICASPASAISNIIHIAVDLPNVPIIAQNGDTLVSTAAVGYQWYNDTTLINGQTNRSLIITADGEYAVETTDSNGCTSRSALFNAVINGISRINSAPALNIYPNPANDVLNIKLSGISENEPLDITLYDALGQVVINTVLNNAGTELNTQLSLENFAQGLYMLKIKQSNWSLNKSIVLAK